MIISNILQQSPEWFAEKAGKTSASSFDKIITTKGDPSKSAIKYMYQLAGERIAGLKEESYQNGAMQRGIELEAEAREFYELVTGTTVEQIGIAYFNEERRFSCSPDGLVSTDGMIEIKCPLIATHVGYLIENELPIEYFQQVQGQLLITGRNWCDFVSYFPGLKPLIIRVEKDIEFCKKLEAELDTFCNQLEEIVKKIA